MLEKPDSVAVKKGQRTKSNPYLFQKYADTRQKHLMVDMNINNILDNASCTSYIANTREENLGMFYWTSAFADADSAKVKAD